MTDRLATAALSEPSVSERINEYCLEANLAALGVEGTTLDRIRSAEPCGEIVFSDDGTPLLRMGDHVLGRKRAPDDLRACLGDHRDGAPIVVFGLGTGHLPRAIRQLTRSPIAVFEPDPGVARTVLSMGPTTLGDVRLVSSVHELTREWPTLANHEQTATLLRTPGYVERYPDEHERTTDTVLQLVQRVSVNANTHRLRARAWVEHVLVNVEHLCEGPSFLALARRYAGVPAFIVGSGPSLSKNVESLRVAGKKGIVIAVNSSARALARFGIEPQVLACIESIDVSHRMLDLPFIDRVVRVFSLTAHPRVLATGNGPLLPIYEALPELAGPLRKLTGYDGVSVCGSVSTAAISLAERLGCSPIVLVGQDLAYTDGKPYAVGTGYESSRATFDKGTGTVRLDWNEEVHLAHGTSAGRMHDAEPLFEVEAWGGGGTVVTGASFNAVRAWLEHAAVISARALPDLRLVNATEGGARIVGFEEARLADVLEGLPDRSLTPESIAGDAREAGVPLERAAAAQWAVEQLDGCGHARRAAKKVRRRAERAKQAVGAADPATVTSAFRELDEAERELADAIRAAPLIEAWTQAEVQASTKASRAVDPHADSREQARQGIAEEGRLATALERSIRELERELDVACTRLASRTRPCPERTRR